MGGFKWTLSGLPPLKAIHRESTSCAPPACGSSSNGPVPHASNEELAKSTGILLRPARVDNKFASLMQHKEQRTQLPRLVLAERPLATTMRSPHSKSTSALPSFCGSSYALPTASKAYSHGLPVDICLNF